MIRILSFWIYLQILFKKAFQTGVGVDFGSQYHKACMLLPDKYFTMVEDSISKNKTPSLISFCQDKRFLEYQAQAKFSKNNCDSFFYLNRYLEQEQTPNYQFLISQQHKFRDRLQISKDSLGLLFHIKKSNLPAISTLPQRTENSEEFLIRFEEIYGILLRQLKKNAEKTAEQSFKNGVFTIWDNSMTIEQRKKFASSVLLADFYPSAFVHENTAAAVYYTVNTKLEDPNYNENLLMINIGASGTKISLVNIKNLLKDEKKPESGFYPQVENMFDRFYPQFSGFGLDYCFANYSLKNSKKSEEKKDFVQELDSLLWHRLLFEIGKPKEILSANKESRINIENFFKNLPLTIRVYRSEFEEHCNEYFKELQKILQNFKELTQNKKIDKIEIIGGVIRVPKILEKIQEFYNMPIGQHVNGDDGPAMGAAFIAANYTAGVKTKQVGFIDGPNYEVHYTIEDKEGNRIENQQILFPYKSFYDSKRTFTMPNLKEDLLITLEVKDQNYQSKVQMNGLKEQVEKFQNKTVTNWEVDIEMHLDKLGIPKVEEIYLFVNETIIEKVNVTQKVLKNLTDDKKNEEKKKDDITEENLKEGTEEKTDDQDNLGSKSENETIEENTFKKMNKTQNQNQTTFNQTNTTIPEYEYVTIEEIRNKTKSHKIKIPKERQENINYLFNNKTEFDISKNFIKSLEKYDEERLNLIIKKNELEGFIFKLKDYIQDSEKKQYLKEEEKNKFLNKSEEIDNYMFSPEIENATIYNITEKVNQVNDLMKPFLRRIEEHFHRENLYQISLERYANYTKEIEKIHKRKNWLNETNVKEYYDFIDTHKNITHDLYIKQKDLPLFEDPIFHKEFIQETDRILDHKIKDLRRIQKPKSETNSTTETKLPDLENFKPEDFANFDPSKMNMSKEQIEAMKIKMEELREKLKDLEKDMPKDEIPKNEENQEEKPKNEEKEEQQKEFEIPDDM